MKSKSKVAVVRCDTYEETAVFSVVQRGIDLIGGMSSFIKPGEKILLKPNVLIGDVPEKSVSPHPLVLKAVARLAQAVTQDLSYGDSPGFGKPAGQMRRIGFAEVAEEMGIPLADFENGQLIQYKESPFIKHFMLANAVLNADGLISIPKFKTHQLVRITGAVKNQFGCVPGAFKAEFHLKLPDAVEFAKMLVVLNLFIKPRLYVLDGITAMEGNGPRNGDSVKMNVMLFSSDPVALDSVMCRLINLNPEFVPTMQPGKEWGLGTYLQDEIELVGDPIEPLINKTFNVVRTPAKTMPYANQRAFLKNLISPRPVIDARLCTQCGTCVKVCPAEPKAVNWHDGIRTKPPSYKYERCIRCFCCQELCPERAITVTTPLLGKILGAG